MSEIRIIIAGTRTFKDYDFLNKQIMASITEENMSLENIRIISGHAKGADSLGEQFAKEHNLKLTVISADWDKYNKSAGYIRNEQMAKFATNNDNRGILFAFWDGKSSGTKNMIDFAKKYNMKIHVYINEINKTKEYKHQRRERIEHMDTVETLTREQKQNVFRPMLENFETDQMKEYFMDMVVEIPDYIFTMESSTSGKYHNKTQCETYGQLWHVYMFSSILNHRLRLKGNQEKFKSPIQRDCMRCVPVFHDAIKCGLNGSTYTVHDHPLLASKWVLETKVEHDIDDKVKKVIADMCAAHSGEWTTSKRSKEILPEPKNDMEFFIHECDILSSRNDIDMIIPKELKELVEENIPIKIEIPDLTEYKISFGKHSGKLLTEVPKDYLKWLVGTDLKEPLKSLVIEVLKGE